MASLNANERSFIELMGKSEEHARHGFDLLLKRRDFVKFFDPLVDAGMFAADRNPGPVPVPNETAVRIPYWTALDYLVACAKVAGERDDTGLAEKILTIVRDVSAAKPVAGQGNFHTFRKFAEILGLLPMKSITREDLESVQDWLHTKYDHDMVAHALSQGAIPRFLASAESVDWQKAVQLVRFCTEIRWQPSPLGSDSEEPAAVVEEYWLEDLIKRHASALGSQAGQEAAALFRDRVAEVFGRGGRAEWSHVFRPAVGDEGQRHRGRGVENSVVEGLRDVLLAWCDVDAAAAGTFVDELIRADNEMLRRVAIYVLSERWDVLRALYLPAVRPELFDAGHLHELHALLRKRFDSFSEREKAATIDAIRSLPIADDEEGAVRTERLQLRWLSGTQGTPYSPASTWFSELTAKHGQPPKHPDSLSYIESRWGPGPSPYNAQELAALAENRTIVRQLQAFKPSDTWEGPTAEALADQLERSVLLSPAPFLGALPDFIGAPVQYQHAVINGFLKLWREPDAGRPFDDWDAAWTQLLEFLMALLRAPSFWSKAGGGERSEVTPMWIAAVIADLLHAGTRDDARAYPQALLPTGWSLLQLLLEHGEPVSEPGDDPMFQAINSTRGRAIEAAFSHILRSCRLADKESGSHAGISAQARHFLDSELEACRGSNFEFSTLAGAYIANLEYIDSTWLQQNVGTIFSVDRQDNFACAVGGLAYASANRRNYVMLRDAGVIDAALRLDARGRDTRQKLMERVALGYLWGEDALDSTRFAFLLGSPGSAADLEKINFFFWTISGEKLTADQVERVLAYWRRCIEWAETQLQMPVKVMSSLSGLAAFLPDATSGNRDLLLAVTPHVHIHHSAYEFLKELDRLIAGSPEGIRDVLARFIETHEQFYDYEDRMCGLVSQLADLGFRADAIRFCEALRSIACLRNLFMKLTSEGPATGLTTA